MSLILYDAACRALAEATRVDEAKSIADKATALAAYARQAKNVELEIQSAEIRAGAKRRMGEISAAMETAQGRRQGSKHSNNGVTKLEALEAAGVSKMEACRCEKLAAVRS